MLEFKANFAEIWASESYTVSRLLKKAPCSLSLIHLENTCTTSYVVSCQFLCVLNMV